MLYPVSLSGKILKSLVNDIKKADGESSAFLLTAS